MNNQTLKNHESILTNEEYMEEWKKEYDNMLAELYRRYPDKSLTEIMKIQNPKFIRRKK